MADKAERIGTGTSPESGRFVWRSVSIGGAPPGRCVAFTGTLIDITGGTGTPVITADPGEILYIGDGPPDAEGPEDEDFPETGGPF